MRGRGGGEDGEDPVGVELDFDVIEGRAEGFEGRAPVRTDAVDDEGGEGRSAEP